MRDRMQDRGPRRLRGPGPPGPGGLLGAPLALDRDVDQTAKRLRDPLDLPFVPGRIVGDVEPNAGVCDEPERELGVARRGDRPDGDPGAAGPGPLRAAGP